jgi:hypothetical protein
MIRTILTLIIFTAILVMIGLTVANNGLRTSSVSRDYLEVVK